jgi:hypothetical protein
MHHMTVIKKGTAGATTLLLALSGAALLGVGTADAHTPSIVSTCNALTVNLTNYADSVIGVTGVTAKDEIPGHAAVYDQEWFWTKSGDDGQAALFEYHPYVWAQGTASGWIRTIAHRDTTTLITAAILHKDKVVGVTAVTAEANTVKVVVDGVTVGDTTFGKTYGKDFIYSDSATAHTYSVTVVAWDGPAKEAWSFTKTGTSVPCVVIPPKPPVIDPKACVAIPGWATEDILPLQGQYGLIFAGPHPAAVDTYQRVTSGNMQGLTGMSYTILPGSHDYVAQMNVEVNPNAILNAGGPVLHYATLSTINAPTSGVIDAQNANWYTTKIAYASPGGQGHPITWAAMIALMPNNALLSAPSLHLQTQSTADSYSVVSAISSSCGATSFVPTQPAAKTRSTVVTGSPVCTVNPDKTLAGGGTISTITTSYKTPYVWNADSMSYVLGVEVQNGPAITTVTGANFTQCPATVIVPPTVTPPTVVTPPVVTAPVTHAVVTHPLAFTGGNGAPEWLVWLGSSLLLSGLLIGAYGMIRRRRTA